MADTEPAVIPVSTLSPDAPAVTTGAAYAQPPPAAPAAAAAAAGAPPQQPSPGYGLLPGGAASARRSPLDWFSEMSRSLDQSFQQAATFLETNSALLANTFALDKLSEFDGVESLKVIYAEDPETLTAMQELLLLKEQARSMNELALHYSQVLAECGQSGQMFGDSMQRLAFKKDPRTETLWESSWSALSFEQLMSKGTAAAPKEAATGPLPEGLSTIQQLLWTMAQAQLSAHARMMELAETSPVHISKAYEAMQEQYKAELKPVNDKYMEAKRRWRYALNQAAAHRQLPEEAAKFDQEAVMWRRQWEACAPDIREHARRLRTEHQPKVTKVLAAYVQAQLKLMNRFSQALQRDEYKTIELA